MPSKTLDIDGQSLQGWLVNLELAWPGQNFVVTHKLGPPFGLTWPRLYGM